jgi:hypothetical protein
MSKEIEQLKTRLFALGMRLGEVEHELGAIQTQLIRLERASSDARLAHALGDASGEAIAELRPQIAAAQKRLEEHEGLHRRLKRSQWEARTQHAVLVMQERRRQREQRTQSPPQES